MIPPPTHHPPHSTLPYAADDNEILKRMQLQKATPEEVDSYVPAHLRDYVPLSVYDVPQQVGGGAAGGPL